MSLKCPIDDVNVLRLAGPKTTVRMWLSDRIDRMHGPDFATVEETLEFIKDNLAPALQWKCYCGTLTSNAPSTELLRQITLTDAARKPYRTRKGDNPGRCIAKGSIEEVWPVFESYVRMI